MTFFMTQRTILILTLFFVACSAPDKENNVRSQDTVTARQVPTATAAIKDPNWATYKDTVNMGFVVAFKYPKHLYAEHFENAECIGKKIKMVDDGPMTTMDCSMWMDDISEGNVRPIDTLIQYDLQKLKVPVDVLKDTVDIANVKGTRARYFDRKDKAKILGQSVFFSKYDTFFEVNNEHLSTSDFEVFMQSLTIDKNN
jgi:hypothetical protein